MSPLAAAPWPAAPAAARSGRRAVGSVASEIAPGGIGSIGNLTIGSLITASNLTLNFDLTTPGGSGDLLTITTGLTLARTRPSRSARTRRPPGDYRSDRRPSLTRPRWAISIFPPRRRMYSLSTAVDPGYIDLVVAVPEPSTLVLLGVAAVGLLARWRRKRTF